MNELVQWEIDRHLEATAEALRDNGFEAVICATAEKAAGIVLERAADAKVVGFGGSMTLAGMDLARRLGEQGKECLLHGISGLSPEERLEIMRRQLTCDLFLTAANAVTMDGKLVNIDATGNRVGALTFGPRKVLAVAGSNKLVEDVHAAVRRIKNWVAPPNARRLGMKTPCAETGFCSDCRSPDRICRVVHILERRPRLTDFTVLLVGQPLGF